MKIYVQSVSVILVAQQGILDETNLIMFKDLPFPWVITWK